MDGELFINLYAIPKDCGRYRKILACVIELLICNDLYNPSNNELGIIFERTCDREVNLAIELKIEMGNVFMLGNFIIKDFFAAG